MLSIIYYYLLQLLPPITAITTYYSYYYLLQLLLPITAITTYYSYYYLLQLLPPITIYYDNELPDRLQWDWRFR